MQKASEIRPNELFIKKKSSSMCRGGCTDLLLLLILLLFSIKSFLIVSHAVWLPIVIGTDFALSKTKNGVVKRNTPHSPRAHWNSILQIPIHHAAKSLIQSDWRSLGAKSQEGRPCPRFLTTALKNTKNYWNGLWRYWISDTKFTRRVFAHLAHLFWDF